jgi:hypothetical protein
MGVKVCLTLREEHRLRVFENRVLRRIFGPKREEVVGGWRRTIRVIIQGEWGRAHSMHGRNEKCVQNFFQKIQREATNHMEELGIDGKMIL